MTKGQNMNKTILSAYTMFEKRYKDHEMDRKFVFSNMGAEDIDYAYSKPNSILKCSIKKFPLFFQTLKKLIESKDYIKENRDSMEWFEIRTSTRVLSYAMYHGSGHDADTTSNNHFDKIIYKNRVFDIPDTVSLLDWDDQKLAEIDEEISNAKLKTSHITYSMVTLMTDEDRVFTPFKVKKDIESDGVIIKVLKSLFIPKPTCIIFGRDRDLSMSTTDFFKKEVSNLLDTDLFKVIHTLVKN